MTPQAHPLWTLGELGEQVQRALAATPLVPRNGRIRAVPDRRTIRYYTTIGLIDRPAAMRGRTALYGQRHLHQLLAIKQLQARGLSLAEVHERLIGLADDELATLASLPQASPLPASTTLPKTPPIPNTYQPNDDRAPIANPAIIGAPAPPVRLSEPSPITSHPTARYQGFALASGITLLLQDQPTLSEDDIRLLQHAAAPLLDAFRLLGTKPSSKH